MSQPRRPFPCAPLEAVIAAGRPDFHATDVAKVLGVGRNTVREWRRLGLSCWQADRYAVAAGFHPAEVWPDWPERLLELVEAETARPAPLLAAPSRDGLASTTVTGNVSFGSLVDLVEDAGLGRSVAVLAELFEVEPATVQDWALLGIPLGHAERCSLLVGCSPAELWPDWPDVLFDRSEAAVA